MKRISLAIILIVLVFNLAGQRKDTLVCPGSSVNVWAFVEGYSPLPRFLFSREVLQKGFTLELSDKSYKIVGFNVFFDFDSCPLGDQWIKGNTVTMENFSILRFYKDNHGVLNFPCIVIEKKGIRYKATNDFFILPLEEKKAAL